MGLIKAAKSAVIGALSDQWLEVVEAYEMSDNVVFCEGIKIRKGENVKGTENTVSNGSIIHVYPNQFMMLVDGGRVVDYTAEEGYYKVSNSSSPSLFNGEFKDTLKDSFERIKFGGETSKKQRVFFINLQEIKGNKFGTKNPINYFDNFYNAELFLRAHGTYSIKIIDPLRFYSEVIPKDKNHVKFTDIDDQYLSEFLEALQSAMGQMSVDGIRISHIQSKGRELGKYMSSILDEEWNRMRGMEIQSVGLASISYDEESQKLINMRNKGAMLSDPYVREGFVQGSIASGIESAGANSAGATAAFMGMGIGMNSVGGFMNNASAVNMSQMKTQQNEVAKNEEKWQCECGALCDGNFCSKCGKAKMTTWICSCGCQNDGNFCKKCGTKKSDKWVCECGCKNDDKFCKQCGKKK